MKKIVAKNYIAANLCSHQKQKPETFSAYRVRSVLLAQDNLVYPIFTRNL